MEATHDRLCALAETLNCTESTRTGHCSRHVLPDVVSFADLARLHSVVKDENRTTPQLDFVTTSGRSLVFSTWFGQLPIHPPPRSSASKKRMRDDTEDKCDQICDVRRRQQRMHTDIPEECYATAETVLVDAIRNLRGTRGEIVIQSVLLVRKKLQYNDAHHSLVVALRLNAGIPIPVTLLKRVLGPCWQDGVVTSLPEILSVNETDLPMSEEGAASHELGNSSMLVVTSVRQQSSSSAATASSDTAT